MAPLYFTMDKIQKLPCGDKSHDVLSDNADLEARVRARCKIPKSATQAQEGTYRVLKAFHRKGVVDQVALDDMHKRVRAAWDSNKVQLGSVDAESSKQEKGEKNRNVRKELAEQDDWVLVEDEDLADMAELRGKTGKAVHIIEDGLR